MLVRGSLQALVTILVLVALVMTGCTAATPVPTATPVQPTPTAEATPTTPEAEPSPSPTALAVEIGPDGMLVPHPLFIDEQGKCTKNVKLKVMGHGDYLDPTVDERYALGLLYQRWDEGQPCVELEWVPIPPGEAPGWATSQFIAGTPPDIVQTWPSDAWFDNKWVISWDEYLTEKNPYSPNDTWFEDIPMADLLMPPYSDGKHYYIRIGLRYGPVGLAAIFYNADILREAGVDVEREIPPKTMSEFFDILRRVKENTDKVPFWQPFAGDTRWEWYWYTDIFASQLLPDIVAELNQAVDENDDRWGSLSVMEGVWGILSGKLDYRDPRVLEQFRIFKEWSKYFHSGYASPGELVGEVPAEFLRGNVAMVTAATWRINTLESYGVDFEWGTFHLPPIDTGVSQYATGEPVRRIGGTGEAVQTPIVPYFVPTQVKENPDKFAAVLDLARYLSAPASQEFYCSKLVLPCYEIGTPLEEVFGGDQVRLRKFRGFFEPVPVDIPTLGIGGIPAIMSGGADEVARLMVEYFQDRISLEQLGERLQEGVVQAAKEMCAAKLADKVPGWEWCTDYVQ